MAVDLSPLLDACSTANQKRVIDRLQNLLDDSRICPQGYLPPQRRLAELLDISTPTLKHILIQLEQYGIIRRVAGGKRVIAESPKQTLSLLTNTVVVLVSIPHFVDQDQIPSGDLNTIHISITQSLNQKNINTLQLCMEKLDDGDLDQLINARPKGFIVLADTCCHLNIYQVLEKIRSAGVPLVVHGYGSQFQQYHTVQSDHEAGAYMLARFLIERGHEKIIRYWELRQYSGEYPDWLRMRDAGYERAISEAGLDLLPTVICQAVLVDVHSEKDFKSRVQFTAGSLISYLAMGQHADAIMALTDEHVYSLAAACREFGKQVHSDVAVVGYDNYWYDSNERKFESAIPLATIDKRNFEIGKQLTRLLLEVSSNGQLGSNSQPIHYVVEPELIVT